MNDILKQRNIIISIYADDTALLAQGKTPSQALTPLQNYLTKLEAWLIRWKIKLNVDKPEAILFFKQKNDWPKINIYDTPADCKNEVKYLGVILDKNLTFKYHPNHAREKFNKALRAQYSLICRNSSLSIDNKMLIYLAYLRPILAYASPIWGRTSKSNLTQIQVLENKTLRMIGNARWYHRKEEIRTALKIASFTKFIRKLSDKFYADLLKVCNASIAKIPIYDPTDPSNRKRPSFSLTL
ncbi:RNA-directed DNA polymerase from mobile element jockey [Araneus ventricosus]|uniref:RNA-directed DNA polymerase from mobile element jockey n=1 Tax=Araneus ventricosus TaxID=182803 RepID=A0A4Y2MYS0_ARAVE|nr:RNA-directed DNA polymerase from mobile element jockey [Araneus ventricosus]